MTGRAPGAAALALVVIAGCGGGGEKKGTLSKQELIARGDALCTRARSSIPSPPRTTSAAAIVRYTATVIRVSESTLARFKSLEPPSEQRDTFNRFLAAAGSRLDDVRGEQSAARRGDLRAVAAVARREARIHAPAYRAAAAEIGFKVCGSGLAPTGRRSCARRCSGRAPGSSSDRAVPDRS